MAESQSPVARESSVPGGGGVGEQGVAVAIIGMGAWGLAVLERLLTTARAQTGAPCPIVIHVVEPRTPGPGVYSPDLPPHLIMNTPCGQISLWPGEQADAVLPYQVGLLEWARREGYGWHGDLCIAEPGGVEITEHDFLPRRVVGRYLNWFYQRLVESAPRHVQILLHATEALDLAGGGEGRELVRLASGEVLAVDHVMLTSGHTGNRPATMLDGIAVSATEAMSPSFPVQASDRVAICGMGLSALDVLTVLTSGRGGRFEARGDGRLRYRPSGDEPRISMFSRSGLPPLAKAVGMRNSTTSYRPGIWTPEAVGELRGPENRPLNWQLDLFPLLTAEMQLEFYTQAALLDAGEREAARTRARLIRAWRAGAFEAEVELLASRLGRFDPREHFYPQLPGGFPSAGDYQEFVIGLVERDLAEALRAGGSSPVKRAFEVLRFLRDPIRRAVEFGGLDDASHLEFFPGVRARINRLVAGPPARRAQQLLALVEAGVVSFPYGPSPQVRELPGGGVEIRSTGLAVEVRERVDALVRGFIEDPMVDRSSSALLDGLYRTGRLRAIQPSAPGAGGVRLTRDAHPIDALGQVQERLWVFGALTEGARYFTNCIPSPGSRRWSFVEAERCAREVLALVGPGTVIRAESGSAAAALPS